MAESMMFKQLAFDPQTPSTTTQKNPNVNLLTATIMQQKKLEELEKKLKSINFLCDKSDTKESSVNYMGDDSRSRSSQRPFNNSNYSSVKWKDQQQKQYHNKDNQQHNRQRSTSSNYRSASGQRNKPQDNHRNRDRSKSPYKRPPTPKDDRNKQPRDK
jgi:hypothetical protein